MFKSKKEKKKLERQNKEKNFQFFFMEDLKRKIGDLFSKTGFDTLHLQGELNERKIFKRSECIKRCLI